MSHLRLNLLTGRWVTMVAHRAERPTDFRPRSPQVETDSTRPCPFCPEQQHDVPAVLEHRGPDGLWHQRIIANLYPAFDGDEPFAVHHHGPVHIEAAASGIHEVFISSRDHTAPPEGRTPDDAIATADLLRTRLLQHAELPNLRYTQAIINHGREAGASLAHPHGQLLALPFVPGEILDEQRAFGRFEGGCVLCATVEAESVDGTRIVLANDEVVVVSPYWAGTPYELLIIPRAHAAHLPDSTDESLHAVAVGLQDAVGTLRHRHGDVAYNAVLHTAPHAYVGSYHWHIHLFPKLISTAGFERGTGVMINIVTPETAAGELRQALVSQ